MDKLYLSGKNGQGKFTLLDKEDFEYFKQWKWHLSHYGYATRKPKSGVIYMHKAILNTPVGFDSDHINRNKLDNRRSNLRILDKAQSQWNKGIYKNNTSGFKGVQWDKKKSKWKVRTQFRNKEFWIGRFDDLEVAAEAYQNTIERLHNV